MLKNAIKKFAGLFLGRKLFQPIFEKLYFLSLKGMNIGGGSFVADSGEQWILEKLANTVWKAGSEVVVFDVGANKGEYSLLAHSVLEKNSLAHKVYAFEPSHSTFGLLKENVRNIKEIIPNNFGFSSVEQEATLYSDSEGSGMASLFKRDLSSFNIDFSRQETISLTTLDKFCAENNIKKIDFLKLDVEGNEMEVLKSAKNIFSQGKVECLQFEFGGANIDARVFLRDFVYLLKEHYSLYRILKDGLEPLNYSERAEIFITTNFLAVRKI